MCVNTIKKINIDLDFYVCLMVWVYDSLKKSIKPIENDRLCTHTYHMCIISCISSCFVLVFILQSKCLASNVDEQTKWGSNRKYVTVFFFVCCFLVVVSSSFFRASYTHDFMNVNICVIRRFRSFRMRNENKENSKCYTAMSIA